MVLFNHATREMTAKIVYYGPGLCGKTTNLLIIFDKLDPDSRGKMLSLATKTDRTLFFDLLPVDIGKVGAFNLKIQLYTVPGQVFYNETRKLVLRGADAIVFVVDSQPSMVESNRESFKNLLENMVENQIDINDTPIVIQFNKRDIPGVLSVEQLQESLGMENYPYAEAAAIKGEGVMETFKLVSKVTAKHLFARLKGKPTPANEPPPKKAKKAAAKNPAALLDELRPSRSTRTPDVAKPAEVAKPVKEAPNPFADSVPFPDSAPSFTPFPDSGPDKDYEAMEEVSLEQLLEGRDRPTFSGDVAVPVMAVEEETVEDLAQEELLPAIEEPEDSPVEEFIPDFESTGEPQPELEMAQESEVQAEEQIEPELDPVPSQEISRDTYSETKLEQLFPDDSDELTLVQEQLTQLRNELKRVQSEQKEMLQALEKGLAELTRVVQQHLN